MLVAILIWYIGLFSYFTIFNVVTLIMGNAKDYLVLIIKEQ